MVGDGGPDSPGRDDFRNALAGVHLTGQELSFDSSAILQLFESIPVAISVTEGPHHRYVYVNERYRSALVPGQADPRGLALRQVLGDSLPGRTYGVRDRVLSEARVMELAEEPIPPRSENPSMYWDVTFFPLLDEAGMANAVLTFAVDVTGRVRGRMEAERRAELERRRAEEASFDRARLALAVEATSLGIWEWNVETGETIWSDTQKAIWGLSPDDEASYEYWRNSIHPDDREHVLGRIEQTLDPASGGGQRLEHRIVRPSGAVRWISSHGRMVFDDATSRPLRLIGTALDITRQKNRDEDLRHALESREILLREVNHRVKNSLQIVSSLLSLQSARLDDEGLRGLIQDAQLRVQAVAAVHDRLYRSVDLKSVDLEIFLESLCRDVERTMGDKDAIEISVAAEPVTASNDRAVPLALILNELLTNAVKYAYPDGRGTVAVSLSRLGGGRARLTVADDGVGLPDGWAERSRASLGFHIIEGLARQIDAEIEIAARNPGTAISVDFDLAPG